MPDVFITFGSEDEPTARRVAAVLEAHGWTTFWDHTLPPGGSWNEVIGARLDDSRCQLVLWSEDSINQIWVLEEARHGLKRGNLIAVYVDDIAPPPGFSGSATTGLVEWDDGRPAPGFQLVDGVAGLIGPPPGKSESAVESPEPPAAIPPEPPADAEPMVQVPAAAAERSDAPPVMDAPADAPPWVPATQDAPPRQAPEATPAPPRQPARPPAPPAESPARTRRRAGGGRTLRQPVPRARPEPGESHRPRRRIEEPELVVVPGGTWRLPDASAGASADVVRIVKSFAIGRFPVTFEEYDRFVMETGQHPPSDRGWGRSRRPVIDVLPEDALAFTRWLAKLTGKPYRLPTDTEWRYVAGVSGEIYQWSGTSNAAELGEDEWYWPSYGVMTHPVNALPPNDLGVYDLKGNVWEWVLPNEPGAAPHCLSMVRRLDFVGFRVACDPE